MILSTYLYKNDQLVTKFLNIDAIYDKTMDSISYQENETEIRISHLKKDWFYCRENQDTFFLLKSPKSCEYTLKDHQYTISIPVLNVQFKITDNQINIEYTLASESDVLNRIEIIIESGSL